ncbi:MAG: hypothetical protein ACI9CQ_004084 [Saprospiraceae bacterium]|jgi:hypothetical protein
MLLYIALTGLDSGEKLCAPWSPPPTSADRFVVRKNFKRSEKQNVAFSWRCCGYQKRR